MEELASCLESHWVKNSLCSTTFFSSETLGCQRKNNVEACKKASHLTCAEYLNSSLKQVKQVRECSVSAEREGKRAVVVAWGCPTRGVREPNSH